MTAEIGVGDGIVTVYDPDDDCLTVTQAHRPDGPEGVLLITAYDTETRETASVLVSPEAWAAIVATFPPTTTPPAITTEGA